MNATSEHSNAPEWAMSWCPWIIPHAITQGRLKWKGTLTSRTCHLALPLVSPSIQCHHVWSNKPLFKPRSKVKSRHRKGQTRKTRRWRMSFCPVRRMLYLNIVLMSMVGEAARYPICALPGRATNSHPSTLPHNRPAWLPRHTDTNTNWTLSFTNR